VNKINKLRRFLRGKIDVIIYILMGGHVRFLRVFCLVEQKVCLMVWLKELVKETKVSCTKQVLTYS